MRLDTAQVTSDLFDKGIDAVVIEDTFNVPYLHVKGQTRTLEIYFNDEGAEETLDFDYAGGYTLSHNTVEPWNYVVLSEPDITNHDAFIDYVVAQVS